MIMEQKHLYLIQDLDRPMHVVARSWESALGKWKQFVALENDMEPEEVEEPLGIVFVADNKDLIC